MNKFHKIGLFGGTFDPPHQGHLILAEWILCELKLETIYFIPARIHAFKQNEQITSAEIRFELLCKAIAGYPYFRVSRIEIDRPEISYSVETIRLFRTFESVNVDELVYIIGADNLQDFHQWKEPQEILRLARVVTLQRPVTTPIQTDMEALREIEILNNPRIEISSTMIRERIKKGLPVLSLLSPAVYDKIKEYGLYGN